MDEDVLRALQMLLKKIDKLQKTMDSIERNTRQIPISG